MRRRSFFASAAAGAAALGAMPLVTPTVEAQTRNINMKIKSVELWQVTGDPKQYDEYLEVEYPRGGFVKPAPNPNRPLPTPTRVFMKITTDAGVEGFYGPHDQNVVDQIKIIRSVVGADPLAIDTVWESLVTGNNAYTGPYMFAVSAITNTLWDLKGRFCGLPVYKLLGGSRKVLDCYATCIDLPINTQEVIAEGAERVKNVGFFGQKWFPTQGPRQGAAGLNFNIEFARTLREVIGPHGDFMMDGLTRWDLPFCLGWCKGAEQYRPRWLEEPVQTYLQIEPLAQLRKMFAIPIATGEHNYNRWVFHDLMKAGAVDVLTPDTEWCGGISEVVKICNMASAWGLQVSPHHMKQHALAHLVASQPASVTPYLEYRHGMYMGTSYFDKYPIVHNGKSQIELSDRPGFGVELDEKKVVKQELIFSQT